VFAPTAAEVERARRILAVDGVARLDGEMVDAANRRMAESILARLPSEEHEKGRNDD
jgi:citrate lyase beta subunit